MYGSPETSYKALFNDVSNGNFYSVPVTWASQFGVITGYTDGSGNFGPADDITREQLATMLYRYANKLGYDTTAAKDTNTFPDGNRVSSFAQDSVRWCLGTGIITGDQGNINPQGTVNRAVCATMISRFINTVNNTGNSEQTGLYKITVSCSKHGTATVSKTSANSGETINLNVSPDTGYMETVSINRASDESYSFQYKQDGSKPNYSFKMPNCDVIIRVNFIKIESETKTDTLENPSPADDTGQSYTGTIGKVVENITLPISSYLELWSDFRNSKVVSATTSNDMIAHTTFNENEVLIDGLTLGTAKVTINLDTGETYEYNITVVEAPVCKYNEAEKQWMAENVTPDMTTDQMIKKIQEYFSTLEYGTDGTCLRGAYFIKICCGERNVPAIVRFAGNDLEEYHLNYGQASNHYNCAVWIDGEKYCCGATPGSRGEFFKWSLFEEAKEKYESSH